MELEKQEIWLVITTVICTILTPEKGLELHYNGQYLNLEEEIPL